LALQKSKVLEGTITKVRVGKYYPSPSAAKSGEVHEILIDSLQRAIVTSPTLEAPEASREMNNLLDSYQAKYEVDIFRLIQRLGTELEARLVYLGGGIVLAGTTAGGRIYRSTDYGLSWTLVQQLDTETYVYSLVYLGGGIVLAGTYPTGQVYRSTDYGLTWSLIQRLGTETYVWSLVYLGSGIVLAGTATTGQIYRSTDYGLTWSLIRRLDTEKYVMSLVYLGSGIVLAGTATTGQIYRSTDYGLTWSLIQRLGTEVEARSLVYLGSGIVLAGTSITGEIYRSTDYGLSWTLAQRLGTEADARVMSLVYLGGGIVLAGRYPTGQVYRSTNYGLTWSLIQRLGTETYVWSLVYLGSGIVLAGTALKAQIYRMDYDVKRVIQARYYPSPPTVASGAITELVTDSVGRLLTRISGDTLITKVSGEAVKVSGEVVSLSGQRDALSGLVTGVSGQTLSLASGTGPVLAKVSGETLALASGTGPVLAKVSGETVSLPATQVVKVSGETVSLPSTQVVKVSGETLALVSGTGPVLAKVSGETVTLPATQPVKVSGETVVAETSGRLFVGRYYPTPPAVGSGAVTEVITDSAGKLITRISGEAIKLGETGITLPVDIQAQYRKLHASTTTALSGGASWTSTSEEILDRFSRITGTVFADAAGTLYAEQSPDNTNWDLSESLSVSSGVGAGFSYELKSRYVRVRYVNGATAQTTFRLYAYLRVMP
jgi:hypothetical protein